MKGGENQSRWRGLGLVKTPARYSWKSPDIGGETTAHQRTGALNSLEYLDWVRSRPCVVCLAPAPSEASHLTHVGMGRKKRVPRIEHYTAISMCSEHHREYHQLGPIAFPEKHNINLWEMNALQLQQWLWGIEDRA